MTTDSSDDNTAERLRELHRLRDEGLITDDEFEARRNLILDRAFGSEQPAREAADSPEPPERPSRGARAEQRREQSEAARSRSGAPRVQPPRRGTADRAASSATTSPRWSLKRVLVFTAVGLVALAIIGAIMDSPDDSDTPQQQPARTPVSVRTATRTPTPPPPVSATGTGSSVARMTLRSATYTCAIRVERNYSPFGGSGTNFILTIDGDHADWSDLLVNDIAANGSWEKIVRSNGGPFLFEVEAAQGASWSIRCAP